MIILPAVMRMPARHAGKRAHCNEVCARPASAHGVQQQGPDISLLSPALQRQWDHAANAHLGNIVIKPFSNRKVAWKCDACPDGHLHQWTASVKNRTNGNGCPRCSGYKMCKHNCLATIALWAAAQWDYEANTALGTPNTILAHSHKQLAGIAKSAATDGLSPLPVV